MIIGVDNGLTGGLVAISKHTGGVIAKTAMPTKVRLRRSEIDTRRVYEWVMSLESPFLFAVEEPLHHARSSQAVRSMGISFGKLLGLAESREWDHCCVAVHNWQKKMLGRVAKGETKRAALRVAAALAPDECWRKSKRATTPHDGMIDAFLIARYLFKKTVGDS
jgi:hypothetical protein|tara:strand:- start:8296 stop:8787 length:492 start_codon:yes stop_codon:yes gene_type:complete